MDRKWTRTDPVRSLSVFYPGLLRASSGDAVAAPLLFPPDAYGADMNTFWCILAVLGLAALTANAFLLHAILERMPVAPVTMGQYKAAKDPAARLRLFDQLQLVRAFAAVEDNPPINVKIEDQPIEVHPVRHGGLKVPINLTGFGQGLRMRFQEVQLDGAEVLEALVSASVQFFVADF